MINGLVGSCVSYTLSCFSESASRMPIADAKQVFSAVSQEKIEVLNSIFNYKYFDFSLKDDEGNNVFHHAASSGNQKLMSFLIEKSGHNLEALNDFNNEDLTPVLKAFFAHDQSMLTLLCNAGAGHYKDAYQEKYSFFFTRSVVKDSMKLASTILSDAKGDLSKALEIAVHHDAMKMAELLHNSYSADIGPITNSCVENKDSQTFIILDKWKLLDKNIVERKLREAVESGRDDVIGFVSEFCPESRDNLVVSYIVQEDMASVGLLLKRVDNLRPLLKKIINFNPNFPFEKKLKMAKDVLWVVSDNKYKELGKEGSGIDRSITQPLMGDYAGVACYPMPCVMGTGVELPDDWTEELIRSKWDEVQVLFYCGLKIDFYLACNLIKYLASTYQHQRLQGVIGKLGGSAYELVGPVMKDLTESRSIAKASGNFMFAEMYGNSINTLVLVMATLALQDKRASLIKREFGK